MPGLMNAVPRLLFVCIENSNRSQMSEAFARILGGGRIEAFSAGSKPSGKINPKAIRSMQAIGYDLSTHHSKSIAEVEAFAPFAAVVLMGCGDSCPTFKAERVIEWEIPDPRDLEPEAFDEIRNLLGQKVKELLNTL
jgi:protein-tyrosine-phosphatase